MHGIYEIITRIRFRPVYPSVGNDGWKWGKRHVSIRGINKIASIAIRVYWQFVTVRRVPRPRRSRRGWLTRALIVLPRLISIRRSKIRTDSYIHVFDIHVSFPFDERESRSITSLIRSFFFLSFFSFSFEIDRVEAWNVITRRIFAASLVKYFITGSEPRIWMKYLDSREPRIIRRAYWERIRKRGRGKRDWIKTER